MRGSTEAPATAEIFFKRGVLRKKNVAYCASDEILSGHRCCGPCIQLSLNLVYLSRSVIQSRFPMWLQ